jgi:uncharacterized protein
MDYLSKFSIPFANLTYGDHQYEYDIENTFFESFSNSAIQKGKVRIELNLNRAETMMVLDFNATGHFELECDRCLEMFDYPIDEKYSLVVKLAGEGDVVDNEDDVVTLTSDEHSINVAQHIYDYLILALPYRKVHPDNEEGESTCNPEFLKTLDQLSHHEENHADPRWEALKKLKK